MEKITFNRLNIEMPLDKFKFSMIVGSGAKASPEVTDFYIKALIDKTDAALFNNVPGNKGSKRIPILTTGDLLAPFNCSWAGKDVNLDAKEVSVDKVSVMVQICISDIEDSFEVWNMTSGANNPVNPQALLSYIWGEIARKVRAEVEFLRWNGNKGATGTGINKLTNGYMTLLKTNVALISKVTSPVAITPSNVVAEFYRTLSLTKKENRMNFSELNIFVSSNVYLAFITAASTGNNSDTHLVSDSGDMYLGKYKITEVLELPDNTILTIPKQDVIYTYDLEDENFLTVDMSTTTAEPVVRFRMNLYFGFDIYDYANVVYYGPAL